MEAINLSTTEETYYNSLHADKNTYVLLLLLQKWFAKVEIIVNPELPKKMVVNINLNIFNFG